MASSSSHAAHKGSEAGAKVTVRLYPQRKLRSRETIFAIWLARFYSRFTRQYLANYEPPPGCINVGSQRGLLAFKAWRSSFCRFTFVGPTTGEYNLSYIRQYLSGSSCCYRMVGRKQGLCVKKGISKQIHSLQDLVRPDITFVNRQRGAGTRGPA